MGQGTPKAWRGQGKDPGRHSKGAASKLGLEGRQAAVSLSLFHSESDKLLPRGREWGYYTAIVSSIYGRLDCTPDPALSS